MEQKRDCTNSHPCQYKKSTCIFNHVETKLCVDDDACVKSKCAFNHTNIVCMSFVKGKPCTNPSECPYRHPGATTSAVHPVRGPVNECPSAAFRPPAPVKPQPSAVLPTSRGTCRNEAACPSMTSGCIYNHPGTKKCRHDNDCSDVKCRFNHTTILCPSLANGVVCTKRLGCQYRHVDTPSSANKSCTTVEPLPATRSAPRNPNRVATCTVVPGTTTKKQAQAINAALKEQKKTHVLSPGTTTKAEAKAINSHLKELHNARIRQLESENDQSQAALRATVDELVAQYAEFQLIAPKLSSASKEDGHRLRRELYRFQNRLPAYAKRSAIEKAVEHGRFVIVQGQTGSGKSTQIPQYLAELKPGQKILVTQPRKVAAIALAERVAVEYVAGNDKIAHVGEYVGYRVGGKYESSAKTRIEFITEGVLLEMILSGKSFRGVGAIVIDEAHERSITCDLLLGSLKQPDDRWADIPLVVTSATIDVDLFSKYFDNAPVIDIPGRMFPVDIQYAPTPVNTNDMATYVASVAHQVHLDNATKGDVLCFLPGQDDVLRAKEFLDKKKDPNLVVLTLYGKQDHDDQKMAFAPAARRKIIFATDIAETSVTIPGVVVVVDSGLKKGVTYDPVRKIASLKVQTIARSSAIQRTGRAGRTQPGHCLRLYSNSDFEMMETGTLPEIFRQPLALAVLTLRRLGIDPRRFAWLSAPSPDAMAAAETELQYLGALDPVFGVTTLGETIASMQQPPHLVRMLVESCKNGLGEAALAVAAVQSVAHMFSWRDKTKAGSINPIMVSRHGDVVAMVRAFETYCGVLTGQVNVLSDAPVASMSNEVDEDDDVTAVHLAPLRVSLLGQYTNQGNDDDDEDDTASDTSDVSDISSDNSIEPNSPPKTTPPKINFQTQRKAQAWCRQQSLNSKALGLAMTLQKELRDQVRHEAVWKGMSQSIPASDDDLRHIVFFGSFLNIARLKPDRGAAVQYCAIQADVVGLVPREAAIVHSSTPLPEWIVFDSIFRPGGNTLLNTTTPVEYSWLERESAWFRRACDAKLPSLPTSTVTIPVAATVLKKLTGKHLANLEQLESTVAMWTDVCAVLPSLPGVSQATHSQPTK
ncbi:hypothetical protein As57867_004383, partial [Aphanomyces stellatus]